MNAGRAVRKKSPWRVNRVVDIRNRLENVTGILRLPVNWMLRLYLT
jgi:hypothetical protein